MKKMPPKAVPPTELEDLRARLNEAESVLTAIRNGQLDALLVTEKEGKEVHTLSGSYRHLIETMSEGAATLFADGSVLYCNPRLEEMLGIPHDQLLGTRLQDYLQPDDQQLLESLLAKAHTKPLRKEINLKTGDGHLTPVYLSAARLLNQENEPFFNLVITDLTEQKQHEKIIEAERLARLILEQAEEAIIVCDEKSEIIRINQAARQLCTGNPLASLFNEMFPLQTYASEPLLIDSILKGKSFHNVDITLELNGQTLNLLMNAGPLASGKEILGGVILLTDITVSKQAEKIIQTKNEEQERFNRAAVGRELRMIALKEEINDLRRQLGQPASYVIHDAEPKSALPEPQKKGWLKKLFGRSWSHDN